MFSLKRIGAAAVILAVAWLGLQRVASAEPSRLTSTQGVLSAAACNDANCVTLTATITTPAGTQSFVVSRGSTAVRVGAEQVSPATLERFVGALAIVLSTPVGSQQVAGRIDVLVFPVQGSVSSSVSNDDNDHGNPNASQGDSPNKGGTSGGANAGGGTSGGGTSGGGTTGGGTTGGGTTGGGTTGGGTTGGGTTGGTTHGNGHGNGGNGQGNGQGNGGGEQGNNGNGHQGHNK
jgi:hypothetical protein